MEGPGGDPFAGAFWSVALGPMGRLIDDEDEAWQQVSSRSHPVRSLLDAAAGGYQPVGRDIEQVAAMAFPEDRHKVRSELIAAAQECRQLYGSGAHAQARRLAAETSFEMRPC